MKTPRLLFCVPNVVYLCDLQMSNVTYFPLDLIKTEF